MSSDFWAGILGAIVGAMAGGGATWLIQYFENKRQIRETNKALAHSLLFKFMQISSDLSRFEDHIKFCDERAKQSSLKLGWQSLRPFANLPRKINIDPAEISYLLNLKKFDLVNRVFSLDLIHSASIDIFEKYENERSALTRVIAGEVTVSDETISPNDESLRLIEQQGPALDTLATAIRLHASSDAERARRALIDTSEAIASTLGYQPKLEFVDGALHVAA